MKRAVPLSEDCFKLTLQNAEICATYKCCATGSLPFLQLRMTYVTPPIIMYSSGKNASMFNAIPRLLHSFYSARSRREHVKVFPKPT